MRILMKSTLAVALIAGGAALGSCADRGGYGYTGVSVGYNASYGDPYWGWYGDYYYPGTGIYVYDRGHRRMRWNETQRGYWEGRRSGWHGDRHWRSNWGGFRHRR